MSEIDSLNDSELRAKCRQYGLPNIPVTDTSRKILIKKLELAMKSPIPEAASGVQKKTNRRETIHVAKTQPETSSTSTPTKIGGTSVNRPPSRTNTRRTIAATSPIVDEEQPVPVRRRSRSIREETLQKTSSTSGNKPIAILESDEEDDLVMILDQLEKKSLATNPIAPPRSQSRAGSYSKTEVTVSYKPQIPSLEEEEEDTLQQTSLPGNVRKNFIGLEQYGSNLIQSEIRKQTPEPIGIRKSYTTNKRYTMDSPQSSSSYYSSPVRIYQGKESRPQSLSGYYAPPGPVRHSTSAAISQHTNYDELYNEHSDDADGITEEPYESPYLSKFTRSLERIKSQPIGRSSFGGGLFKRTTPYETPMRRSYRENTDDSTNLMRLWHTLEQKYHLKEILAFIVILLVVIFLFVIFWQ